MKLSIYKILTESEWTELKENGIFLGTPADRKDGFIHLSKKEQIEGVLFRYYSNQRPLYLVEFSAGDFGDSLRWENSSNGEKFPHVYGRALHFTEAISVVTRT